MEDIRLGQIVMVGSREARVLQKLKYQEDGKYFTNYEVELLDNKNKVVLSDKDFNTLIKVFPKFKVEDRVKVVYGLYKGCEGVIKKVLDVRNGDFTYEILFAPYTPGMEDIQLEDWLELKEVKFINKSKDKDKNHMIAINECVEVIKEGKYYGMVGYVKTQLPGYTKNRYSIKTEDNTILYFYENELKVIHDPMQDFDEFFDTLDYMLKNTVNTLTKEDYIKAATQAVDIGDKEIFEYYMEKVNNID